MEKKRHNKRYIKKNVAILFRVTGDRNKGRSKKCGYRLQEHSRQGSEFKCPKQRVWLAY